MKEKDKDEDNEKDKYKDYNRDHDKDNDDDSDKHGHKDKQKYKDKDMDKDTDKAKAKTKHRDKHDDEGGWMERCIEVLHSIECGLAFTSSGLWIFLRRFVSLFDVALINRFSGNCTFGPSTVPRKGYWSVVKGSKG